MALIPHRPRRGPLRLLLNCTEIKLLRDGEGLTIQRHDQTRALDPIHARFRICAKCRAEFNGDAAKPIAKDKRLL
ncbi:hypothetical protein CDV53_12720 [Haematobacter missouriensis]|uniref:Uncharacterized protein n=1 Tax=Haematobacter missouriensis TaxID=366616 RepID=A0ABX3ZV80_9RHOB|nr:hypothetical protein CDV53_12720 [Haematobacter missouriensis]